MEQIELDVSELPAPEPFDKIMRALELMTQNNSGASYLKVEHRKQPLLLYKPLAKLGYQFHVQAGERQPFEIYIWPSVQPPPCEFQSPNIAADFEKLSNHSIDQCSDC